MLTAENLAAFRGERLVFSEIALNVAAGGALVLTGPNGSGKSTLLRVLAGLVTAEAGRVAWHGADLLADRAGIGRVVAYVGHLDALKPGLTAAENLRPWGSAALVADALERMALAELARIPVRMLSAGQRRRLALARLLLSAAPVWLLDEPTLALDAEAVARLGDVLAAHRAGGGVVLAATHVALPLAGASALALA